MMNYETQFRGEIGSVGLSPQEDAARRRRRRVALVVGVVAALVLVVSIYSGWQRLHGGASQGAANQQIPGVTVIEARGSVVDKRVSGTGSIAARRDMPVGVVGEGGRVEAVLVEPGDWVRAGQPLVRIERSVQSEQVASLAASVEVARADAKLAESNLVRAKALVGQGFISKADLESKTALRDAAVARVNVAVAQLNQARASMARLDVRAPAAGLVLSRTVEPGQIVSGGSGVLFRIAMNGEMEMKLAVNESDLPRIRAGDRAEVTPIGTSAPYQGNVWQVSPMVDPQSRQGVARILLRYDPAVRPGAFAQATIISGRQSAFVLPQSAVQSDDSGPFVYIVDHDNHAQRRAIRTGEVSDAGVAVTGGLSGGEHVVLSAGGFLNPGDRVKPVLSRTAN
jgi:RND family efflux transporter MFP subunit